MSKENLGQSIIRGFTPESRPGLKKVARCNYFCAENAGGRPYPGLDGKPRVSV